jgi:hypothetical protein
LLASFFPDARLWGLNQTSFIKGLALLYPVLFFLALLVYWRASKYPGLFGKDKISQMPGPVYLYPYLLLIFSTVAFYFLSVKAHFLGDGSLLIAHLSDPSPVMKSESYGEMIIHKLFAGIIGTGTPADVYASFKYISIASGFVFILSLLYYGRKIVKSDFGYYVFIFLNLFSAFTILFFGYVETYSMVTATLTIFFLSSITALKNNKKSVAPIIAFILAVFLHKISLVFTPALFIYLALTFSSVVWYNRLVSKSKSILLGFILTIFLTYIVIQVTPVPLRLKNIFLPPFSNRFTIDGYALLSANHIIDFLNILIFLIPIGIIIFILLRKFDRSEKTASGINLFVLIAAFGGLQVALLFDPKLGMARDYDLMSTMFIGAQLTAVFLWVDRFQNHKQFIAASALLFTISLSVFIPWLTVNNSVNGLYEYAISVMELDPKHSRTGFYTMLPLLESLGDKNEAARLRRYCTKTFPETELHRQQLLKTQASPLLMKAWHGFKLKQGIMKRRWRI